MKVTSERLRDSQVLLQIEVEPERSAKSIDEAYRRLVNRVSIPGFRKGRAPRQVVERLLGREAIVHEGIDHLLPQVYREAVAETGIEPIDQPQVDIVQQEPLVVKVTVAVRPEVELEDYSDIRADRDTAAVREDEVEGVLQRLREEHAEWLPVERPVVAGDLVNIELAGNVRGAPVLYNPQGEPILETEAGERVIDQKGVDYRVLLDNPAPVKGFAQQLVGLKSGEDKRFELNFPADYPNRELANKAVIFQVVVNSVKEQKQPDLDDEFAKTVGDYATTDDLRQSLGERLRQRKEAEAEDRLRERVLNLVTDRARIELPNALIERETDRLVERVESRLRQADVNMGSYLQAVKKNKDELRTDYRADAIANLRRHFVLDEVAKREGVEVTAEEVDAEIRKIAEVVGERGTKTVELLSTPERRDDLADDLRHRKALDRLVAIAVGPADEQARAADVAEAEQPRSQDEGVSEG